MASWGEASESRLIGKRISRLSGKDKVTGKAKYTFDINRPGMLYGRILRSEVARATVMGVDTSEAEALPGVKAVIPLIEIGNQLRYQGQEIAAVAAETDDIAKDALRLIHVDHGGITTRRHRRRTRWQKAHRKFEMIGRATRASLTSEKTAISKQDSPKPLSRFEATYHTPVQTHVCLETHGHVAEWGRRTESNRLGIYTGRFRGSQRFCPTL